MTKKITGLLSIVITLTSCKTFLFNQMFKDPVVETSSSIKAFQAKNKFSVDNSFIIKGDTTFVIEKLLLGMTDGYNVFDKNGNQVCYNGSSTCQGTQFRLLLDNQVDSFKVCSNQKVNLEDVLKQTYDLNENEVNITEIDPADYYIVIYWQKFLGGRKGYKNEVEWMEDEIKKVKSEKKIIILKINTDLQDTWGLKAGQKAELIVNRSSHNMTFDIKNLPVRK